MKPNFRLCDICKSNVPENITFFVETGLTWNPSKTEYPIGNWRKIVSHILSGVECENDRDGQDIDLCHLCCIDAIKHLISDYNGKRIPNHELGNKLLTWFDKAVAKNRTPNKS